MVSFAYFHEVERLARGEASSVFQLLIRCYTILNVICRIPFYYTLKTIFLLYLALPQAQGASYLYKYHLQPFLDTHEAEIDANLLRYKGFAYRFVQDRLRTLWGLILESMGQGPPARSATAPEQTDINVGAAPLPSLQDPASGPLQMLGGLWRLYGPTVVAAGTAAFQQTAQATRNAAAGSDGASLLDMAAAALRSQNANARELASPVPYDVASTSSIPVQHGSSSYLPLSGSEADLRARVSQFEEVEVPSDIEGYDVEPNAKQQGRPSSNRRTSWFGWPAAGGSPSPALSTKKSE